MLFTTQQADYGASLVVKSLSASAGDTRDKDLIPGSGRSPVEVLPLQYSCLRNPMDRGAWRSAVRGVAEKILVIKQQ